MTQQSSYLAKTLSLADLPLRADLQGKNPYGAPQITVPHLMNTNENPYPPSERLCQAISHTARQIATDFNRYPDRDAIELRKALAEYINHYNSLSEPLTYQNIWAANGSNEILQQILQAFAGPGTYALGTATSFAMHSIITEGTNTLWHQTPRKADFTIDVSAMLADIEKYQPRIIFITRPNNPTGNSESLDDVIKILQAAPGLVVLDEAYAEFSSAPSALELYQQYSDTMIIIRTMSKAFAFAGGRLGYLIAQPAVIDALQLVRLPYHLSAMTQAIAITALEHAEETLSSVAQVIRDREYVSRSLKDLGYKVLLSDANFLLFGDFVDEAEAWKAYLAHDILVRDLHIPGKLRVSIGTEANNAAFLACSAELVSQL